MTDRRNEPTQVTSASSSDGRTGAMRSFSEGERIGRYTVIGLLGRGGMGAVYEAEDPELARRVAIKILHEDRNADERDALRREAQALATLVHQNVVMVYDVGVDEDGDVFLVMQLVEGETINAWIERTKPAPDVIIAKFRQAGAGLAAAHAAGLVHCDFKPANVLIDDTGAVRVGDFGLARRSSRRITGPSAGDTMPTLMTTLAGTPAYMAPEQFDGVVTPASDQFAFCVALWECLAGERPFEDSSVATLDPASRGERRELPSGAKLPGFARRVLERGMKPAPTDRFSSMTALLAALAPRRVGLPIVGAAVGVVAIAGVAVYVAQPEGPLFAWDGADLANRQTLTDMGTTACAYAPMVDPGGTVVFDRTEGETVDLYSVPLAGGPSRQLTSGPGWEWRAQPGRRPGEVSFLSHDRIDDTRSHVAYLDLATGKQTVALAGLSWDAVTVGDRLYFSPQENKGVWVLRGEQQSPFVMPESSFTFYGLTASHDGSRLAVSRLEVSGGDIAVPCTVDIPTRLVACLDLLTPNRPAFGRDPTTLYVGSVNGIVRHDLLTGVQTKIVDDYAEGGLTVTPDGSALIFSACRSHAKIIDAANDEVVIDDPDGNQPSPSSAGAYAWLRTIAGRRVVMVRNNEGLTSQLTQPEQGTAGFPRLSPDGKRVVFALSKPRAGLHTIDLGKVGSVRPLTTSPYDHSPYWVGESVAFTRTGDGGDEAVFIVGTDGSNMRQLSTSARSLYGVRGNELLVGGVKGSYWVDPVTGKERPGPPRPPGDEPDVAVTSPSGEWIVFQMGSATNLIYRARTMGTAEPELVRRFDSNISIGRPAITDDGQVWIPAGPMYGDLVKIPAKPGEVF